RFTGRRPSASNNLQSEPCNLAGLPVSQPGRPPKRTIIRCLPNQQQHRDDEADDGAVLAVRDGLAHAEPPPARAAAGAPPRLDSAAIQIVLLAEGPPQQRLLALDRRRESPLPVGRSH